MSDYLGGVKNRRRSVLKRLEQQLKEGTRKPKKGEIAGINYPLTEKDVLRINKEIDTIKTRI